MKSVSYENDNDDDLICTHYQLLKNCIDCNVEEKYADLRERSTSPKRRLIANHIKSKASIEKLNAVEKAKVSDENEIDDNSCLFEDIEMPTSKIPEILANRK